MTVRCTCSSTSPRSRVPATGRWMRTRRSNSKRPRGKRDRRRRTSVLSDEQRDVPPVLCEPDGVGAFAAADVEGLAWLECGCLADERVVGLAAPDLLHAGVARIP